MWASDICRLDMSSRILDGLFYESLLLDILDDFIYCTSRIIKAKDLKVDLDARF